MLEILRRAFEITIGNASHFVGLEITRNLENKSVFICQSSYVKQILNKFGMSETNCVNVPADSHTILYPVSSDEECESNFPYREAVGSLMYLSIISRPDIAYAVNSVSRFLNKNNKSH